MKTKTECESELFFFIDSATPETRSWVSSYLTKQGIALPGSIPLSANIPQYLFEQLTTCLQNSSAVKEFAANMRNAWRVRKHRKQRKAKSLTISLKADVMAKLTEMSKGETLTHVITQLIEGNYPAFLNMKREIEQKKADAKEIARRNRETNKLKKMMIKPEVESLLISKHSRIANNLENIVSLLSEMIAELAEK